MKKDGGQRTYEAVVIGASAGGIAALRRIVGILPPNFSVPILVVQHMHPGYQCGFSIVFNNNSGLVVKEAEDKEFARPGTLYVAPPGYHLLVERDGSLALSVDDMVNFSRPSIDILFETAADAFAGAVVGVVLTGANQDGALGLKAVKDAGGLAIVEDPSKAEVPTMPRAAMGATQVDHVLSLDEIGILLAKMSATGELVAHVKDQDPSRR